MSSIKLTVVPQLPDLDEIRRMRKRLELSQRELASLAGVSQSLVAKVEKGTIDPSYGNVRKIFKAFEGVLERRAFEGGSLRLQSTVSALATRGVVFISPEQTLAEAVELMVSRRFTQLPVMVGDRVVGSITDDHIRDYTIEETRDQRRLYDEVMKVKVGEIMLAPFPILNEDTPIELASLHLQKDEAILVACKGAIEGILTSADFLRLGLH